jgi:aspartate aminotransferase
MPISDRASAISPSLTLSMTAKVREMRRKGIDVIGFSAGEPDFDTPDHIKEAGISAIRSGFTKYTADSGIVELKDAVIEKFRRDNKIDYDREEILISCGAKHALFNAIFAICGDGDEVIVPAPYWVSYIEQIKLSGAVPVIVNTREEDGFKLTESELKDVISSKTKVVILNSPSNPTGAVYDRSELEALTKIAEEHRIYIISDEIYEYIIYDGRTHESPASFSESTKALTITINGVSKSYSMTGWRIGYAGGPKDVIKAMSAIQSHTTSNPTSVSQKASLAALLGGREVVEEMVSEFGRRRRLMVDGLNQLGLCCLLPAGSFYAFCKVSHLFSEKIRSSFEFANYLLEEAKVAVVPGDAFGAPEYIRLSYATSYKNIEIGLARIEEALRRLR